MNSYTIFTGTDPTTSAGGIGVVMSGYIDASKKANIPYECIPTYDPGSFFGRFVLWMCRIPCLVSAIRKAKKNYERVVVYSHVGSGFSLVREFFIHVISRMHGAFTIHHSHAPQALHYFEHALQRTFFRFALSPANGVVVLTQFWKTLFQEHGINKPIRVIHNPLPPDLFSRAHEPCVRDGRQGVTVLTMARLAPGKGVEVAVAAAAHLPEGVRIVVAGDGAERPRLERMAQDLGVADRVEFKGWVRGDEKTALLEEADIFCLPSTNDAYPMTFVEAMSYGLPVVGVRYAGIPDIVDDGKTGILVDQPDPEMVADALARLADPRARWDMGSAGQQRILAISSPDEVGKALWEAVSS